MLSSSARRMAVPLVLAAVMVALAASAQEKDKSGPTNPQPIPGLKPEVLEACKKVFRTLIMEGLNEGADARFIGDNLRKADVCKFVIEVATTADRYRGGSPASFVVASVLKSHLAPERWNQTAGLLASILIEVNEKGIERIDVSPERRQEIGSCTIVIGAAAALTLLDDEELTKSVGPDQINAAQKEAWALFDEFNRSGRISRYTRYDTLQRIASKTDELKKEAERLADAKRTEKELEETRQTIQKAKEDFPRRRADLEKRLATLEASVAKGDADASGSAASIRRELNPVLASDIGTTPDVVAVKTRLARVERMLAPREVTTLKDFEASAFCRVYGCSRERSWDLTSGGVYNSYRSMIPHVILGAQTDGDLVSSLTMIFYERPTLGSGEFEILELLVTSLDQSVDQRRLHEFFVTNVEVQVSDVRKGQSLQLGHLRIWAGRLGKEQAIAVERTKGIPAPSGK